MERICKNCGNEVLANDKFCPNCGIKQPKFTSKDKAVNELKENTQEREEIVESNIDVQKINRKLKVKKIKKKVVISLM